MDCSYVQCHRRRASTCVIIVRTLSACASRLVFHVIGMLASRRGAGSQESGGKEKAEKEEKQEEEKGEQQQLNVFFFDIRGHCQKDASMYRHMSEHMIV